MGSLRLGCACAIALWSAGSPAISAQTITPSPQWVTVDSSAQTVALDLQVTRPPGAPSALLNGSRSGETRFAVPFGWTVRWSWRSLDSTATHSLVVMAQREKLPTEGGRPAFPNAMTRMVRAGLRPGQTDQTTFVADETGWYWLLCGVPGHAIAGEYLEMKVER